MGNDLRAAVYQCSWPAGAWWYALRSNVLVSNYIPTRKSKGVAPWTLFTGRQPDGRNVRVLGYAINEHGHATGLQFSMGTNGATSKIRRRTPLTTGGAPRPMRCGQ